MQGKQDGHAEVEEKYRNVLKQIADFISAMINSGGVKESGFALLLFEPGMSGGRMNYLSNGKREDMIMALSEFLVRGATQEVGADHNAGVLLAASRVLESVDIGDIAYFMAASHSKKGQTSSSMNVDTLQAIQWLEQMLKQLRMQELANPTRVLQS